MKAISSLALAFAVSGAVAGPALAQVPDSVLAISQAGTSILRVNEDGGMVVRGAANVGSPPAAGAGVRMMWFPGRYAFRAGQVSGNQWDLANIGFGSTAFGTNSIASGANSFAAGEDSNASGVDAVSLGSGPEASGAQSVAIGVAALATGQGSLAMGPSLASGTLATAIGFRNSASGDNSVTIGTNATSANRVGAIVFSDASAVSPADSVYALADNQFVVRAAGGIRFYTEADLSMGVEVPAGGGGWSTVSDRNRKMNFAQLDGENVLSRLRDVPVTTWNYIAQGENVRHAGPMAQDFYSAFGLGESDVMISTVDMDGITLAAVKALEARSEAQLTRIGELEQQVSQLDADRAALLDRLQALEERQAELDVLLGAHEADGAVR